MGQQVYVTACANGLWTLALRSKSGKWEGEKRLRFRCGSWRHAGECREYCGRLDFKRCQAALERFTHWTFLVLTYQKPPSGDASQLFKLAVEHWSRFRRRLDRWLRPPHPVTKRQKGEPFRYIMTWETTKAGVPHANVAISSRKLQETVADQGVWVADESRKLKLRWQWYDLPRCFKTQVLEPMQVASGFGPVSTLEPMNDPVRLAAYMSKLARELSGAMTKNQVPITAPRHFRRIRASKNTLPPREHDPDITGELDYVPSEEANADAWARYGQVLAIKAANRSWIDEVLFR